MINNQPTLEIGQLWMRRGLLGGRSYRYISFIGQAFLRYEDKATGGGSQVCWTHEFEVWAKKATLVGSYSK